MGERLVKVAEEPILDFHAYIRVLTDRGKVIRKRVRLWYIGLLLPCMGFFGCLIYMMRNALLTLDVLLILGFSALCIGFLLVWFYVSKIHVVLAACKRAGTTKSILGIWGDQKRNYSSISHRNRHIFDSLAVHTLKAAHMDATQILECSTCELLLSAMSPEFKANHALNATFQYIEQAEAVSLGELLEKLTEAVSRVKTGFIDPEGAGAVTSDLITLGCPLETLFKALDSVLVRIGQLFETKEFYYPQVLQSALAVKNALRVVDEEFPTRTRQERTGLILLGVVKGDIHDIGKNIVKMFLEFNGYEVIDLGVDNSPREFVQAVSQYSPDLVGVSAFINTVIPTFKETVLALRKARFKKPVLVGGIAVNALTVKKLRQELEVAVPGESGEIIYAHNVQEVLKAVDKIFHQKRSLELVS